MLDNLTTDTVLSILRAANVSLEYQLGSLPRTLHVLAVHAAFPSLRSEGSLELDCSYLSASSVVEVLNTFNAVSLSTSLPGNLKSLAISAVYIRSGTDAESGAFLSALGQAIGGRALRVSISDCSMSKAQMVQLLHDLGRNSQLQSLQLSSLMMLGQDEGAPDGLLSECLAHLQNLESLTLQRNAVQVDIKALSQIGRLTALSTLCIPEFKSDVYRFPSQIYASLLNLTCLQSVCLPLTLRQQDDWIAADCVRNLQQLSSLSLLEAKSKRVPGLDEVSAIHMKTLMRDLATLTHLRMLDVSSYSFRWRTWRQGREGERLLSAAVKCMPFLEMLAVSVCRISDETISIAESLLHTGSCHVLRIRSHSCRPVIKLRQLLRIISRIPNLTDLALDIRSSRLQSCHTWRTAGPADLRLVLEHEDVVDVQPEPLGKVTSLLIGDGAHCCSGLYPGAFLDPFDPVLQSLHVNGYHINGQPGEDFVEGLNMQYNLRTLQLMRCSLSPELAGSLARSVSSLELLMDLHLLLHRHCADALASFYRNFSPMPRLKKFELSVESEDSDRPCWKPEASESLGKALEGMLSLESLTLDGWHVSRDILSCLVSGGLSTLTSLQHLTIANSRRECFLERAVCPHAFPADIMASCLRVLRRLQTLRLRSVGLAEEGVTLILRGLMHTHTLERLEMEATLDLHGAESLVGLLKAVPNLRDVEGLGANVQSALAVLENLPPMDPMRCFQLAERCNSACGA